MTELWLVIKDFLAEQYENLSYGISSMKPMQIIVNVLDIILMSFLFFAIFKFINKRRAGKLALGLVVIVLVFMISTAAGMKGIQFILSNFYQVGILAIIIVFQPELRAALEKVGGNPIMSGIKNIAMESKDEATINAATEAIADAAASLAKTKTGAIIVLENTTKLGEYIKSERVIDAQLTSALLQNIFHKNAPLHDGAVIIRDLRLHAAGCFLPMPSNDDVLGDLGSRHRAGVGVSEFSDALVVIVSEETGTISVAFQGELMRNYNKETLTTLIGSFFLDQNIEKHLKKNKKSAGKKTVIKKLADKKSSVKSTPEKKPTNKKTVNTSDRNKSSETAEGGASNE